ncbi:MAG TPA: LysR family transcriptional regulator [Candidatus Merdenecus merdavium]|nr:LysR family transcriptional regulator [Candidatus Merdenecus merdavium]
MNLKHLEAFVSVTHTGSFSKAAEQLYLTQPTVSSHIQALEKELGCLLFVRTTKEVELSIDGRRLYHRAVKMLELEREIKSDFCKKASKGKQRIQIGASTIPGQYILPKMLPEFLNQYPEIQMEIVDGDSMEIIDMVLKGRIILGFTGTKTKDETLVFEPFFQDQMVLITPNTKEYQKYQNSEFPLEQLYHERMIVREEGSGTRMETEHYLEQMGLNLKRIETVAVMTNQESIKKTIANGMGIGIMSKSAAEDFIQEDRLLSFSLSNTKLYRNLYMVWEKKTSMDDYIRQFIQYMKGYYYDSTYL